MLGAPWVIFDNTTRCCRVLYVTEGIHQQFSEAWSMHETWADEQVESHESKKRRLEPVGG